MKRAITICGTVITTLIIAGPAAINAQAQTASESAAPAEAPAFKKEELEQILAPIALYPDALLAQIFMASTYPLEVVEAARWAKEHPDVKGDAVGKAVESQTWDPSVKSLVAFPDVLTMMNEKLDWTQKLGDAFLAQQKDVMNTVQVLRTKAKDAGNLKSSKEQTVKTEAAPAGSPAPQIIIIESPSPEIVYVPTYNPTVVYGAWGYPAYPPYYYYPPGYVAHGIFAFSVGVAVGSALWGGCNWGHGDIDIDINRQNNFNNVNINSNNRGGNTFNNKSGNKSSWQHNSEHRKGVGYKDSATQQKFGKGSSQKGLQQREQYRGRADAGRDQISREGVGNQRDLGGSTSRNYGSSSSRTGGRSSAFGGGGGSSARASSSRGGVSRGGGGRRR